jgi:D-tyrosyl-tRNA(Tyr) deacylase
LRALVQRVTEASVTIDAEVVGSIGAGLVVLLGVSRDDTEQEPGHIVGKVANLRIFYDEDGRFNRSALDVGAEILLVSQFTLYGDTRKGRRPSFVQAAQPELAESLYNRTVELFRETGLRVETGRFQAYMTVSIRNDGPVTIMVDSADRERPRRG